MAERLLQLNILQGKYLDRIVDYIKKNDVGILQMQEVTAGEMSQAGEHNYPRGKPQLPEMNPDQKFLGVNCFDELAERLGMTGRLVNTYAYAGDPSSTFGIATLFKPGITLIDSHVVWMKPYGEVPKGNIDDLNFQGRAALFTKFEIDGKPVTTINTHLAWGPTGEDEPYKIAQAETLAKEIANTEKPFILTGDFNVSPDTKTASMFDRFGKNWTREEKVQTTLNPNEHPAQHLFPPGLAVDYIFTSSGILVKSFKVVDEVDLSDHYGLLLDFEV